VRTNVSIAVLDRVTTCVCSSAAARKTRWSTSTPPLEHPHASANQQVGTLSGGNQQKIVLARWLALRPKVLIVDEPTRGIDVGAKVEVHNLLFQMAASGIAIVVISSELPRSSRCPTACY